MSSALGSNGESREDRKLPVITEHPRHKRRRRGKKRKFNRSDRSLNEGDISENNAANDMSDEYENEALEKDANNAKRRPKGVLIRPIDVPKAPENSTQFIMEDHTMDDHNDSHLYMSFETPDPYTKDLSEAEDARSQDINFMYESIKSLDDSFCTRDFEAAYTTSRYDYYMQLSKPELVAILEKLHLGQKELEEDLLTYDPSSVLEQLQQKLLCLQEENFVLKKTNVHLKAMYRNESNESASNESLEELSCNEDLGCVSHLKKCYNESVESDVDSSVDGNYMENKENFGDTEHIESPDVNTVESDPANKQGIEITNSEPTCECSELQCVDNSKTEPPGVDNINFEPASGHSDPPSINSGSETAHERLLDSEICENDEEHGSVSDDAKVKETEAT